ncbi:UNVERIFIED_CONTAM: hypothetical protein Sradi_3788300 [Sesamum radiatum]|uniref:RNase H type-1 domain-containing protein n=1 Tax=Sesamum radiatum TaxID=300843 RepID=A0AAW2PZX6_SESRA
MKWCPPPPEIIKINFDAAIFKESHGAGAVVVARNDEGRCVGWKTTFFEGITDPKCGEALAARTAVEFCHQIKCRNCIVEGNCWQVINKLNSSKVNMCSANLVAHALTRQVTSDSKGFHPSVFLSEALLFDGFS